MSQKEDRRVIPLKRLPAAPLRILYNAVLVGMVLDRFKAPQWVLVSLATLYLMAFIGTFIKAWQQKRQEIVFEEAPMAQESPFVSRWKRGRLL